MFSIHFVDIMSKSRANFDKSTSRANIYDRIWLRQIWQFANLISIIQLWMKITLQIFARSFRINYEWNILLKKFCVFVSYQYETKHAQIIWKHVQNEIYIESRIRCNECNVNDLRRRIIFCKNISLSSIQKLNFLKKKL